MDAEFQVRTTGELTPEEILGLTRLFEAVYAKPCPQDLFRRKYERSCLGQSFHSLMFVDGNLVGALSAIPMRYLYFGRMLLFAITADLMIDPPHRGSLARLQKLTGNLYEALARAGVAFVFCSLRDQVFQLHQAVSNWRAIGKIDYYAAALRLPYFGPASALARIAVRAWNRTSSQPPPAGGAPFGIEKVNDDVFAAWRYGIFPTNYTTITLPGGGKAIYATELYYPIEGLPKGFRTGVLIDVSPLTKMNFDAAVQSVADREPALNVLAWQGYLPFQPREMMRIPAKFERQPWTLAGRILIPGPLDERVFDLRHWNINLSNGDLV